MKKRILPILLVLCLAVTLLAGCSQDSAQDQPSSAGSENTASAAPSDTEQADAPSGDAAKTVNPAVVKVSTGAVKGEDLYEMFVTFGEKLEEVSGGAMTIDLYSSADYFFGKVCFYFPIAYTLGNLVSTHRNSE